MAVSGLVSPRRVLTAILLAAYAVVVVLVVRSLGGVPASREVLVALVLGGFATASLTSLRRARRFAVGLFVDWLPLVALLALYDLIRGYADGLWFPVHASLQIRVDRFLGRGVVPTVWLQRRFWHGTHDVRWYDYATWATYMSYFFVPVLVLAALWWRSRRAFREFAVMVVVLAVLGGATYVLYPAMPPWLAANRHLMPHVARIIPLLNSHIPVVSFRNLWEHGQRYANNIAAVPSLHAGYTLLVGLYVATRGRTRFRVLALAYPVAMAFALVYSGEHFVADVLLGWLYGLLTFVLVGAAFARSRRGEEARSATIAPMADDEQPEEEPATEPDAAWRERTQQTNELAEELAPPHDPDAERGAPAPNP